MKDIEKKVWGMISPPVIYFFVQMTIELVLSIILFVKKLFEYNEKYQNVQDSSALILEMQDSLVKNSSYITFASATVALIIFGTRYYKSIKKGEIDAEKKVVINDIIVPIILAMIISVAISTILSLMHIDNIYGSYEKTERILLAGNTLYSIFAIGMVVPVAEEFVYRGIMYNRIKREFGYFGAIFFSSLAFGIFHFNLLQGIYAFGIGIILSYCYEKYKNIKVPIFMHMAINIMAILIDYFK